MLDPPPHLSHALSSMYELMHRCMKKKKGKENGYLKRDVWNPRLNNQDAELESRVSATLYYQDARVETRVSTLL